MIAVWVLHDCRVGSIVVEHYCTSEDFGGHPKGIKSRVVHWNSILCEARNNREFKLHVYCKRQSQVENF